MQVTLDIFSGRPNPSWAMLPEDEKELARKLAGLPNASQVPECRGLGYRGFVITNRTEGNGLPLEVRVCDGLVIAEYKKGNSIYFDTNHLEKWLADQARERGHESLIATVPSLN